MAIRKKKLNGESCVTVFSFVCVQLTGSGKACFKYLLVHSVIHLQKGILGREAKVS